MVITTTTILLMNDDKNLLKQRTQDKRGAWGTTKGPYCSSEQSLIYTIEVSARLTLNLKLSSNANAGSARPRRRQRNSLRPQVAVFR